MGATTRHIAVILAVSLVALGRQLAEPGVYSCIREDTILYVNWTTQYAELMAQGVAYPRWMPDAHNGYGSPTFVFYAPLVVFLTAAMKIFTGDIALAITLVKLAGLFLSGLTMYLFACEMWGRRAGLAAAVLYVLLPFRMFDLYYLGVFQSKFAYVWFPLALYFTKKTADEHSPGSGMAGLAATYALLCLTHILSGYMFAPVIIAFGLMHAGRGRVFSAITRVVISLGLGVALAGFYLLPVFAERGMVHLDSFAGKDWGRYWNNYLFYISGARPPHNPFFYQYVTAAVISSAMVGVAAYIPSLRRSSEGPAGSFFFTVLMAAGLFMMADISGPVWKWVPGMSMLIFPTRWAAVVVFAAACVAGAGISRMIETAQAGMKRYAIFLAAPLAVAVVWAGCMDVDTVIRGCRFSDREVAGFPRGMEVEEYLPATVSLSWLRVPENIAAGPELSCPNPAIPVKLKIERWDGQYRTFSVVAGSPASIRVRTFYYPGWRATVDGTEARIGVEPLSGAMLIEVPAGSHKLRLEFRDTPVRKAGWLVSLAAILAAGWLASGRIRNIPGGKPGGRAV